MNAKVSEVAVLTRARRKLAARGQQLRRPRAGTATRESTGPLFIVDLCTRTIVGTHASLTELARELGALEPFEEMQPATNATAPLPTTTEELRAIA
jgi:hypothetical protein